MSALTLSARLDRTDSSTPWGFRLHGGTDFRAPLTIQRVTPGSLAAKCGLQVGDAILKIGNAPTDSLPHKSAQQQIVNCGNSLDLTLQRGGGILQSAPASAPQSYAPEPAPVYNPAPSGYAPPSAGYGAPEQQNDPLQANYNTAPKPFAPGGGGGVPMAVNKQYNSPLNMYSVNNVMDSLSGQTQALNMGASNGSGTDENSPPPPPLPSAPPPDINDSAPPLETPPPFAQTPPLFAQTTPPFTETPPPPSTEPIIMHVPGVRSVRPNLSPKPTRHMINQSTGRSSPSNLGPAPYKPSPAASASSVTGRSSPSNLGPAPYKPSPAASASSVTGRSSPSNLGPAPFKPSPPASSSSVTSSSSSSSLKEQKDEVPDYKEGLSHSTITQSRRFKDIQRMVESGEDVASFSRRSSVPSQGTAASQNPVPRTRTPPALSSNPQQQRASQPSRTPLVTQNPNVASYTPPPPARPPSSSSSSTGDQERVDENEDTAGKYVKAIVNRQYNTPKGLYSSSATDETFTVQSSSILRGMTRDPMDTVTVTEERKKLIIPAATRRIVHKEKEERKTQKEVVGPQPSAVNAVFSALAGGGGESSVDRGSFDRSSSDRGYGSDKSSDVVVETEAKKILYGSDTLKAVREDESHPKKEHEESRRPSFGPHIPAQSRTLKILQKQLDGGGGPAAAAPRAAPTHSPAAAPAPAHAPQRPGAGGAASWAPQVPTGPRKMKLGRIGDAKSMSAHSGAGRVPMCHSCGVAIRGPYIAALDRTWCPAHFRCANPQCGRDLVGVGFVEEGGQLYCERDYEMYLAPPCGKCGQKIVGTWVSALENKFHPHCFLCNHCRQPISDGRFHIQDGEPFCEKDWAQLFQTKCFGCQFPIEPGDRWVEALNENWHSECFNCSTCQCNLEGQPFFAKQGKPYCKKHAMSPRF